MSIKSWSGKQKFFALGSAVLLGWLLFGKKQAPYVVDPHIAIEPAAPTTTDWFSLIFTGFTPKSTMHVWVTLPNGHEYEGDFNIGADGTLIHEGVNYTVAGIYTWKAIDVSGKSVTFTFNIISYANP